MKFNYPQICLNFLKPLSERQREVIVQRFALGMKPGASRKLKGKTLEAIGKDYGITRERVRQIELDGFLKLKPEIKKYQKVLQFLKDRLKKEGGLKREDLLLEDLGGQNWKNQIYFLLNLGDEFEKIGETNDFYPFWTINKNSLSAARKITGSFYDKLKKIGKPLSLKKMAISSSLSQKALNSYLEISKKIEKNSEGLLGLREWPEINPRGIKDRAYLVFKKEGKPLHFSRVATLIDSTPKRELSLGREFSSPNLQTVHNELIKDPRFILVGRGIYALREWGYEEGAVKDIILKILKEAGKPLTKEEVLERVSKKRFVKENTISLNLSNKKYFFKNSGGFYKVKTA